MLYLPLKKKLWARITIRKELLPKKHDSQLQDSPVNSHSVVQLPGKPQRNLDLSLFGRRRSNDHLQTPLKKRNGNDNRSEKTKTAAEIY